VAEAERHLSPIRHSHQFTSPLSGEASLVDNRADGEEALNLLLNDPFMKKEEEISTAIVSLNLDYGCNEYTAADMNLALVSSTDVHAPRPIQLLHSRRRVLERALFLSVIMALLMYIFWPLMRGASETSLHTANKMAHVVTTQTTSISTTQVSGQVTVIPTVQPSVTATPTTQPAVPIITIPIVTPTPTPTVTLTSYEAESSQNTLRGGVQVIGCSSCSEGNRVGYIGLQDNGNKGTLQFNNVRRSRAGSYTLTIYYTEGDSGGRTGYISVNGGPSITFTASSTGSFWVVGTVNVVISLSAGDNTIKFSNSNHQTADIDKIVV
jgi:hypothetical protein